MNNDTFTQTTNITNSDKADIPDAFGWHSYFTLGTQCINELYFKILIKYNLKLNVRLLLTGMKEFFLNFETLAQLVKQEFDHCF